MSLVDLIDQAEDLGNYDRDGSLVIFKRPANEIDLTARYDYSLRTYIATCADGLERVSVNAERIEDAVKMALSQYLVILNSFVRQPVLRSEGWCGCAQPDCSKCNR